MEDAVIGAGAFSDGKWNIACDFGGVRHGHIGEETVRG